MIFIMKIKSVSTTLVLCSPIAIQISHAFIILHQISSLQTTTILPVPYITTPELRFILLSGHLESFRFLGSFFFGEGIGELGDLWPQSQRSP